MSYPAGSVPDALAVGDFNGDGIADLAAGNDGSGNVSVLLGIGNGTFQPAHTYPIGSGALALAAGDFNGDGKADIAAATGSNGQIAILFGALPVTALSVAPNNGAGSAQSLVNTSITGVSACYVWVTPGTGTIWLAGDAGNRPAPLTLGTAGTLQNTQCAVNVGSSSGALSGNTYTLNLAITFGSGFTGARNIYSMATGPAGLNSGWQTVGTWTL